MDHDAPTVAPFSHCSYCGSRFAQRAGWPRRCAACGNVSYRNPLPVAVLAVPVEDLGVLMVHRVDHPAGLALPSGYIEHGERWQDAAARELAEETGIYVDPTAVREVRVRSGADGTLLIFATAPAITRAQVAAFVPSAEVSDLVVVSGPRDDVVFPLDAEVVAPYRQPGPAPGESLTGTQCTSDELLLASGAQVGRSGSRRLLDRKKSSQASHIWRTLTGWARARWIGRTCARATEPFATHGRWWS